MILPHKSTLIVAGVAALALLGAAAIAHYWHRSSDRWQQKHADVSAALSNAVKANESNQAVITEQRVSIEVWKSRFAQASNNMALAIRHADEFKNQLGLANKRMDEEERQDDLLPDCQRLLAMDLDATCPAHSRSLRQRAEGGR